MIGIAILGFGVVGSGVEEVISMNNDFYAERLCGEKIDVKYILDRRSFPDHPLADRVTTDFERIIADPEVLIVVETMGGSHPAYEFSLAALKAGKSVVTSNKEVVSNYGTELLKVASENNVSYMFEASVGGGVPVIKPMWQCLAANRIESVCGILNGTTNYILTEMFKKEETFENALAEAKRLGYAEANPAADIEGLDTSRKICILSSLAYGHAISPDKVKYEGMTDIDSTDVRFAENLGYSIKFLGRSERVGERVYCITAPFFVPLDNPISSVEDVYNGITVRGNAVGDVMFYGRGAGKLPTASAVMSDVLDIARHCTDSASWKEAVPGELMDCEDFELSMFVRTSSSEEEIFSVYPEACVTEADGLYGFITPKEPERTIRKKTENLSDVKVIRVL